MLDAIILSIIEGITEFLPISSSGHLILAGEFLHFTGDKEDTFKIFIQFGAILAVVVLYQERFINLVRPQYLRQSLDFAQGNNLSGKRGLFLLFLTCLPACILGLLLHSQIRSLFSVYSVSLALAVGAIIMIIIEKLDLKPRVNSLDHISPKMAFGIGLFQCLALWPGFSRSAATIIGGICLGANRTIAAEYSFIAAVPIISAAALYDLLKNLSLFSLDDLGLLAVGSLGSFICALLAIKFFLKLLRTTTLIPFAIYRLILASLVFFYFS